MASFDRHELSIVGIVIFYTCICVSVTLLAGGNNIYRNKILFFGFYRCVNSGESLTNLMKPGGGLYVEFVSDSPEFTHR